MKLNLKSTIAAPADNNSCQKALNGIIGNTRRGIRVDQTLDPDSNNPVANKPVSTALAALAGKVDAALQKPTGMTKTKLVGVGTNGQENIEIGDNLTLANGKLSATGGGSGGDVFDVIIADENFETYTGTITGNKPVIMESIEGNLISTSYIDDEEGKRAYFAMVLSLGEGASAIITFEAIGGKITINESYFKQYYTHFITLTDNTSTFYLTYQNTSNDTINTINKLKTSLAGKSLICTGHTDSDTAEYMSGEGGNIVVGVVDNSDKSTSGITIDSSFTITDLVTPVE